MDCGALGYAGGYHDHGNGNAGDTMPLSILPTAIRSFQRIENERDELQAEVDRLRAGIQWARGLCSDGEPHEKIDAFLGGLLR
jgi:hypothetical protein